LLASSSGGGNVNVFSVAGKYRLLGVQVTNLAGQQTTVRLDGSLSQAAGATLKILAREGDSTSGTDDRPLTDYADDDDDAFAGWGLDDGVLGGDDGTNDAADVSDATGFPPKFTRVRVVDPKQMWGGFGRGGVVGECEQSAVVAGCIWCDMTAV
jgi:hypothetical protein